MSRRLFFSISLALLKIREDNDTFFYSPALSYEDVRGKKSPPAHPMYVYKEK